MNAPSECNAFVCVRGTELDITLLGRFLKSLYSSDFPKDGTVSLMGPELGIDNARRLGALVSTANGAEFILMADTDIVVPEKWWEPVREVFASDKDIGIVGTLVNDTPSHLLQGFKVWVGPPDTGKWVYPAHLEPIRDLPDQRDTLLFDGFVVFKSSFLIKHNILPDGGVGWYRKALSHGRVVVTNKVTVLHNKGA